MVIKSGKVCCGEFGGLGLGLAICRATVEAHGGSIAATSGGRGMGASFAVHLPCKIQDSSSTHNGATNETQRLVESELEPATPCLTSERAER